MPQPTQGALHVDTLATNVSVGYTNADYIADQLFPILPVQKQSGIIAQIPQSAFFRDEAKLRAPGTKSQGGGYTVDNTLKFFCDKYSYRHEVPDEVRDNADMPYDQDRIAVKFITDKLFMKRERDFAANLFTTSVWATDQTIGTQWSNLAGSSPIIDVQTWKDAVQSSLGRDPNTFTIGRQVWSVFKWHPDVIDNIKYTMSVKSPVSTDIVAAMLELDKVYVGSGIYTASKEGTAEASVVYSRIWGKHGLLLYVPNGPSLETPAAGYTVVWQRVPGALQYVKRMRNEETEVDIFEVNSYYQQKVTVTKAGTFISGIVA
jgi:hypothetical protein